MKLTNTSASVRAVPAFVVSLALGGCSAFGLTLGYPAEPPTPPSVVVVASDEGSDEDEPMSARVLVIDLQRASPRGLVDFYTAAYPEERGWVRVDTEDDQVLCLVNTSDDRHTELVEVFSYEGSRVEVRPDRYLVMTSRFLEADETACGSATAWIAIDLLK